MRSQEEGGTRNIPSEFDEVKERGRRAEKEGGDERKTVGREIDQDD